MKVNARSTLVVNNQARFTAAVCSLYNLFVNNAWTVRFSSSAQNNLDLSIDLARFNCQHFWLCNVVGKTALKYLLTIQGVVLSKYSVWHIGLPPLGEVIL